MHDPGSINILASTSQPLSLVILSCGVDTDEKAAQHELGWHETVYRYRQCCFRRTFALLPKHLLQLEVIQTVRYLRGQRFRDSPHDAHDLVLTT